MAGFIVLRNV